MRAIVCADFMVVFYQECINSMKNSIVESIGCPTPKSSLLKNLNFFKCSFSFLNFEFN